MKNYLLNNRTKIYFGKGNLVQSVENEIPVFGKRILIVMTGKRLQKSGYLDMLCGPLNKPAGKENIFFYDRISHDPDIEEIKEAAEFAKNEEIESVVGFGGGSAVDAAKAVAACAGSSRNIEEFFIEGTEPDPQSTLPIIAIPTTAGTGAELSGGAIISYRKHLLKDGIRGAAIQPRLAIVDSELTYSMPLKPTAETGFDALAHAFESFVARKSNPYSEMLSENAVKIIGENLRRLVTDLDDHEARDRMSYASMIMGFNVRDVGNCLPHRMQYPVGALTGTSHGLGLAALYPAWLCHEFEVNKIRVNRLFELLGLETASSPEDARKIMADYINVLGLGNTLCGLGTSGISAKELADMVRGDLRNDKLGDIAGIMETIYRESM